MGITYHLVLMGAYEEGFEEACNKVDPMKVRQELKKLGCLHYTHNLKSRIRVDSQRVLVTSVKPNLLSSKNDVSTMNTMNKPDVSRSVAVHAEKTDRGHRGHDVHTVQADATIKKQYFP